jgi:hypothetical protein
LHGCSTFDKIAVVLFGHGSCVESTSAASMLRWSECRVQVRICALLDEWV